MKLRDIAYLRIWAVWMTLMSLGSIWVQAQAPQILDRYIQEALESNLALKERNLSYAQSIAALREAKGLYLPQVSFNASYTLAGGGRLIAFPVGDLLNPVYQSLNGLTGENRFQNIENVNEQLAPNDFHETKIRVIQPLFNSDIYFNYQASKALTRMKDAEREAYKQELIKELKVAYFKYLQTESVIEIYDETEDLLKEILRVNQRLVENDKATYDAVYSAEFELSKLAQSMAEAQRDRTLARSYFNFLLNKELKEPIRIDSMLQTEGLLEQLEILETQALAQRRELVQISYAQDANAKQVALNQYQFLPKVNAVLDVGYEGFGYTFDNNQDIWLAQFSLTWDLFKGGRNKARREQSEIQGKVLQNQEQSLRQQIQLQVQEAYYQVLASRAAVDAAQAGVKSSGDVFRLIQRKYQEDQASLLELQDARTKYTQSRLNLAVNTFQFWVRNAELTWASASYSAQ